MANLAAPIGDCIMESFAISFKMASMLSSDVSLASSPPSINIFEGSLLDYGY